MINMLRALAKKVDNMQEEMVNIRRDENYKDPKAILEIKNTITEMRNAFDVFINRLDIAEQRINELEKCR